MLQKHRRHYSNTVPRAPLNTNFCTIESPVPFVSAYMMRGPTNYTTDTYISMGTDTEVKPWQYLRVHEREHGGTVRAPIKSRGNVYNKHCNAETKAAAIIPRRCNCNLPATADASRTYPCYRYGIGGES